MSSVPRGRPGPRFGKRVASGPRDRKQQPGMRRESHSNTRMDGNSDPPPPVPPQPEPIIDQPPQWFISYMNVFKREMVADIMKALDETPEEEEKRRRYKRSYFMLKSRFHTLESQLEQQKYSQRPPDTTPMMNGHSKPQERSQDVRRNGHDARPVDNDKPTTSVSSPASTSPPDATRDSQGPSKHSREDKKSNNFYKKEKTPENIEIIEKIDENVQYQKESSTEPSEAPQDSSEKTNTLSEDEPKDHPLSKKIRSILNKLTPSNFQNLLEQMKSLNIESEDDENEIINQFFEKAIDEPMYSRTYALLCKQFVLVQPNILHLRSLILSRCESEFEKHKFLDILRAKKLGELEKTTEDASKKLLEEELEQINEENPKEFMGNILFIGELYNEDLLSNYFIHRIIQHLLVDSNETHLEYLCKLLKISGKNFEFRDGDQSTYYDTLSEISSKDGLSPRIKFMIEDVINVRSKGWESRRDDGEEDHMMEIFSFSKVLDNSCGGLSNDEFMETFYKEIQPQFNLFESANFTRELLNSAIERIGFRNEYFEVFRNDEGNKIIEWVGGEQVFLEIVLRELKLFFKHFEEIFMQIPDVWKCLAMFLGKFICQWHQKLAPKKVIEMLEGLKDEEMRRNFAGDLFKGLKVIIEGKGLDKWLINGGVDIVDFVGIKEKIRKEGDVGEEGKGEEKVEEIQLS